MSENPKPEESLVGEFRRLGLNLVSALQAAWETPERKRFQDEMAQGLNDIGQTINREAEKLASSSTGKQIKTEVEQIGEKIRSTETQEKVRSELLKALQTANNEIQGVIDRWSAKEAGTTPGETNSTDKPAS